MNERSFDRALSARKEKERRLVKGIQQLEESAKRKAKMENFLLLGDKEKGILLKDLNNNILRNPPYDADSYVEELKSFYSEKELKMLPKLQERLRKLRENS